jgi:hypothetical protein
MRRFPVLCADLVTVPSFFSLTVESEAAKQTVETNAITKAATTRKTILNRNFMGSLVPF